MKSAFKIFAVEDDPVFGKMLNYLLTLDPDHEVKVFTSGKELLDSLHQRPQVITLDYTLPDYSGQDLLKKIKQFDQDITVIIISAQDEIKTAVRLLREGAFDYIMKAEDVRDRLLNTINNAKRNINLAKEVQELKEELQEKYEFDNSIIGQSAAIKKTFGLLEKAVKTNITVSVTGETGTGKEMVAKAIHFNSDRRKHSFVAVNIAAIPDTLLESELFGYEKGAFTGAVTRKIGKFEEANHGTIFLDEIGEMDLNMQAKLLRVLQERELVRIGGNQVVKLDVRIITATHRDLAEEVKKQRFREDLYYRLLGLPIHLPPLRERDNDVLLLAKYFIDKFVKDNKMRSVTLAPDAKTKLVRYNYPGNIRELKSVVELAVVMCSDNKITADDIQFRSIERQENIIDESLTLREMILRIVKSYLDKYQNDIPLVADKLDIGKSTIYRYLKEIEEMNVQ